MLSLVGGVAFTMQIVDDAEAETACIRGSPPCHEVCRAGKQRDMLLLDRMRYVGTSKARYVQQMGSPKQL